MARKTYSDEEKKKIVDFVVNFDKENGRGGQAAAKKEFGVNPISISNWLEKAGVKAGSKKKKKTKKGKAPKTKQAKRGKPTAKLSSESSVLNRMLEIQGEIESLQAEYAALKNQL